MAKVANINRTSSHQPSQFFIGTHLFIMIIFKTATGLAQYLDKQKKEGKTIGFVPTMGALHAGHLSLVKCSQQSHPITVVSIFVNPTQFNDPKDFEKYPVTIEKDCLLLEKQHTDILFLPTIEEMYPYGTMNNHYYDLGNLDLILDGAYRPGHFQGVCQVVQRLLELTLPNELFIGQKDYQQCMVLKMLVNIMKVNIKIFVAPIRRETDGLAMSSRNVLLNEIERQQATAIYQQLKWIQGNWNKKEILELKTTATQNLLKAGFDKVDYVEIANANNLQLLDSVDPTKKMVALIAAFLGKVRLIDNLILN